LEEDDLAETLLTTVQMELELPLRLLIAIQRCLHELGLESTKELLLGVSEMTAFLSFLYSGAREGDFLDILKKAFFFLIGWIIKESLAPIIPGNTWVAVNKDVRGVGVKIGMGLSPHFCEIAGLGCGLFRDAEVSRPR